MSAPPAYCGVTGLEHPLMDASRCGAAHPLPQLYSWPGRDRAAEVGRKSAQLVVILVVIPSGTDEAASSSSPALIIGSSCPDTVNRV